jgi:hypothetical protein
MVIMEFNGDKDGGVVGSDDEGSSDRIEVVEGGVELSLATLTTQQGLVRASAASHHAQKTAPKMKNFVSLSTEFDFCSGY